LLFSAAPPLFISSFIASPTSDVLMLSPFGFIFWVYRLASTIASPLSFVPYFTMSFSALVRLLLLDISFSSCLLLIMPSFHLGDAFLRIQRSLPLLTAASASSFRRWLMLHSLLRFFKTRPLLSSHLVILLLSLRLFQLSFHD